MSLLDKVKRKLLKKIREIEDDEAYSENLAKDIKAKKEERSLVSKSISEKEKEIKGIQMSLQLARDIIQIYGFMDDELPFINYVLEQYYSLVGNVKIDSRSKVSDEFIDWMACIGDVEEYDFIFKTYSIQDILGIKRKLDEINIDEIKIFYTRMKNNSKVMKSFDNPEHEDHEFSTIFIENFETLLNCVKSIRKISSIIEDLIRKGYISNLSQRDKLETIYGNRYELMNNMGKMDLRKSVIKGEIEELKNQKKTLDENIIDLEQKKKKQDKKIKREKNSLSKSEEEIERADSVEKLGFKDTNEIEKRLGIDTSGYVIIPIPDGALSIEDVFNRIVDIRIEVGNIKTKAVYQSNIAYGSVNSDYVIRNETGALIIPISSIETTDVKGVKNKTLQLSRPKNLMGAKVFLPNERKFQWEDILRYNNNENLSDRIRVHLGDAYSESPIEYQYYSNLSKTKGESEEERRNRKNAIESVLSTDTYVGYGDENTVIVDDDIYVPDLSSIREINSGGRVNRDTLELIINHIEEYLNNMGKEPSIRIEKIYSLMIKEYLRINRKARADYYRETDSDIEIGGRTLSIKPMLPLQQNEMEIIKRFTRKDEDVAYKTMKLAMLTNRFAHLDAVSGEEEKKLYDLKTKLIMQTIQLSKGREDIKISSSFDTELRLYVVNLEIPGYAIISLHVKNAEYELVKEIKKLRKAYIPVDESDELDEQEIKKDPVRNTSYNAKWRK